MNVSFPTPPASYDAAFFNQVLSALKRSLAFGVSRIEAVDSIILQSPNGTPYKITISDEGVITATEVSRGQAGSPNY